MSSTRSVNIIDRVGRNRWGKNFQECRCVMHEIRVEDRNEWCEDKKVLVQKKWYILLNFKLENFENIDLNILRLWSKSCSVKTLQYISVKIEKENTRICYNTLHNSVYVNCKRKCDLHGSKVTKNICNTLPVKPKSSTGDKYLNLGQNKRSNNKPNNIPIKTLNIFWNNWSKV